MEITNFRNLQSIEVDLHGSPVIVGENRVGKSNFLHALRLVLDPSLSSMSRTLSTEDFSDNLGANPMEDGAEIAISVELEGFEDDPGILAALYMALTSIDPMRARLTYRFGPGGKDRNAGTPVYGWAIFGGGDPDRWMGSEVRQYLAHTYMDALRDAQSDLSSWRKSPLRPLLAEAAESADADELAAVEASLTQVAKEIQDIEGVKRLSDEIRVQTESLVGSLYALDPTLLVAPSDPEKTIRLLKVFLDGPEARDLSSASLGALNVLYIALQRTQLEHLISSHEIEHSVVAIEEPEAHLHPHLQRRMFSGLRKLDGPKQTTIVTTHSPHIVSVTAPKDLVILRDTESGTRAWSASTANLAEKIWADLGRYLDATRSEMVFARGVILVEGFAEQVILPLLADIDFDEIGLSVCVIHGTHFFSYAQFLQALGTPFAVVTDGDPSAGKGKTGPERAERLAERIGGQPGISPVELGIFVGNDTFEVDLFNRSAHNRTLMVDCLTSFNWTPQVREAIISAHENGDMGSAKFLAYVERVSKGAYAQRLAEVATELDVPNYIATAIDSLTS